MSDGPLFERARRPGGAGDEDGAPKVWSVSALNRGLRLKLEAEWGGLWVQGEIADLSRAATGHVYFSLNDESEASQLRVVMFRSDAQRSRAKLEKGARVRVFGRVSLYEPRGSMQFIAQRAMPAGEGELAARLRRLKKQLEAEGLTDPARKRPLPRLPRTVGVVTSEHGAALHDILRVSRGRCPLRLVLAPCRVQGSEAPREIVQAIEAVQRLAQLDVVIVARGGGSAEDLWAFNDEAVVRAVAACRVPIVSGVGHETDVTLADLVADVRAATPSNAAELVCPDRDSLVEQLRGLERGLARGMEVQVGRARLQVGELARRLHDPRHALRRHAQGLSRMRDALQRAMQARLRAPHASLDGLRVRLAPHAPRARLRSWRDQWQELCARLLQSRRVWVDPRREAARTQSQHLRALGPSLLRERRHALAERVARLSALSPLSVLARGYAIALHAETGRALRRPEDAAAGDLVRLRLSEGDLQVRVEK